MSEYQADKRTHISSKWPSVLKAFSVPPCCAHSSPPAGPFCRASGLQLFPMPTFTTTHITGFRRHRQQT